MFINVKFINRYIFLF